MRGLFLQLFFEKHRHYGGHRQYPKYFPNVTRKGAANKTTAAMTTMRRERQTFALDKPIGTACTQRLTEGNNDTFALNASPQSVRHQHGGVPVKPWQHGWSAL